jgi:phosphatidate cytidylyltransferase
VIPPPHRDARAGTGANDLWLRVASSVVLVPLALAVAYVGGGLFLALCGLAAGGILWEWTRLVTGRSDARILAPGWAALAIALALAATGEDSAAAAAIAVGAAVAGMATFASAAGQGVRIHGGWAVVGVVYAGVAFLSPALLRRDAELGLQAFLFLAVTVWMTDICAYLVGRSAGGPLLWPQVSPNKTWSGAVAGLAGGVAGGTLVAYASGLGRLAIVGVIALVLSAVAQLGDLSESAIKRHFGVKDTSGLIPGHGGLMDRLDGFLVAALAALLIGMFHRGTAAPADGLLVW